MGLAKISLPSFFIALPLNIIMLIMILRHQTTIHFTGLADGTPFFDNTTTTTLEVDVSQHVDMAKDKLLDGLLAAGFDEHSCLSRYESFLYRKDSPYKPSPYLVSKLRKYEDLHKRCAPETLSYNKAVEQLKSGNGQIVGSADCKYVVWVSCSGLGNRIMTLSSAFLYALLTDRVLLVDRGKDMADLFCDPFPETSWCLPPNFPMKLNRFGQKFPDSYGNMLKNKLINEFTLQSGLPSYLYLHLAHDYDHHDRLFFCDDHQSLLQKIPFLVVKSDNYFVPGLFLMPSFEHELSMMFPDKETVFHHLGRYLFHPTNQVWGLITRYYRTYMAKADERIGIQIRTFDKDSDPHPYVKNQISACTLGEKLLPETGQISSTSRNPKVKAVLMTSLVSGYFEDVRNMYWEQPTVTGDLIGVHQPSHEEHQQTEKKLHDMKALAEMYLLSLSDVLVTSALSTFGYVAQGLGGLKPWILYKSDNQTIPNPPCRRAMSMEPCFHAPPTYDCKAKKRIDTGKVVPHVRHCEDVSLGLKIVDKHAE